MLKVKHNKEIMISYSRIGNLKSDHHEVKQLLESEIEMKQVSFVAPFFLSVDNINIKIASR